MDVRLPDGTVVRGVPEGTTKAQLVEKLQRNGYDTSWYQPEAATQPTNNTARSLGIGTRDVIAGLARVPGMVGDLLLGATNRHLDRIGMVTGRDMSALRMPTTEQQVDSLLTTAGLPAAQTSDERVASDLTRGATSAMGIVGAARNAPGRLRDVLAARPVVQVAAGAGGGMAGGIAREEGASPLGQFAASLAGGLAASGVATGTPAALRLAFRGSESNVPAMRQTIADFRAAGDRASVGQATQNRRTQATESFLSRAPGGAGVMARRGEEQAANVGQRVDDLAGQLAPRAGGEQAGRAIERGAQQFSADFRGRAEQLYSQVDRYIAPTARVPVANAQKALDEITSPIAGAERTSQMLTNPRLVQIRDALGADVQQPLDSLLLRGPQAIPYEALKSLRSRVGKMLSEPSLVDDVPRAELKRLYGALSEDLASAAKAAGPQAERAAVRANNFWRAGMSRVDAIEGVVARNGGPERIFQAATAGSSEGATTLRAVMQSLPADGQRLVTATVLRRLGRANPSAQDDTGGTFSTQTFLTNWNRLSPEAKRVLFDRYGATFRRDMDTLARVASNLRDGSQVFRNPSGTSDALIQYGTVGTTLGAAASGNFGLVAWVASGVLGANLSARLMTNPRFVNWLATNSRRPLEAAPIAINQLAGLARSSGDEDLQEAVAALQQQQNQPNQQGNR